MGPGQLWGNEVLQEQGCGDRAAGAGASVLEVGKLALEPGLVGGPQGHAPEAFTAGFAGAQQGIGQGVVVGPEARHLIPQGDHAGSGEGGQVDHRIRFELAGVHQGIGQGEAPLRIGVVDFDRFAVGGGDDRAGVDGPAADHVFAGRHDHVHLHFGGFELGDGTHGPQHRRAAAHVVLHHLDLGAGGLEVVAAGIEGEALAHKHQAPLSHTLGAVGEVDELGRQV